MENNQELVHPMLLPETAWQSYEDGFKQCLREYEQQTGYTLKIIKKDNRQARVKCAISTCSFTLNLNCRKKDKMWYISQKSSKLQHDCNITKHPTRPAAPQRVIGRVQALQQVTIMG